MARPRFRRSLRFENLESREVLSGGIAQPTAMEQYMLTLVNQARTNPSAMATQVTSNLTPDIKSTLSFYNVDLNATKQAIASAPAKAPLAWDANLAAAAQGHSDDMVANQYQSHTGSDGSSADDRISAAGYTKASSTGENAFAYAQSVDEAMQAFLLDWGVSDQGHRRNILQPDVSSSNAYQSVGIGITSTSGTSSKVGPLVITQDFGSKANATADLLGVVYSDADNNGAYSLGEGQGGIQIDATNLATGQTTSTQTWNAGGYQIALNPGSYQVTASSGGKVIQTTQVTIGSQNVEQDFVASNPWDGRSRDAVIASVTQGSSKTPTPLTVSLKPTAAIGSLPTTFAGSWTAWQAKVS